MQAARRYRPSPAAGLLLLPLLAAPAAFGGYADDVGFTRLEAELGAATPTGAGVAVSQVEAATTVSGQQTWMPDPTTAEMAGKTIDNVSNAPAGLYSGHATGVANLFYGNTSSLAPGITDIRAYWASGWLGADLLYATGGIQPLSSAARVTNHSWVGDGTTANAEILARLDWLIETDEMIQVTAMNNGTQANNRPLMNNGYNSISVGRSDSYHQYGSFAVDATYVAGRARPDLVAPAGSTSSATPIVSAIAALLVQKGSNDATLSTDPAKVSDTNRAGVLVRNAARAEVIRAVLMAGADRVTRNTATSNLALYRGIAGDQTANGLDRRYGAGQVNAYNSYQILASREQNSSEDGGLQPSGGARGFDFDPAFGGGAGRNTTGTYALPVSTSPQLLTASLVWNLDVNGGTQGSFNGAATLRDLTLSVLDVADPLNPVTVQSSASTVDNTENAWLVIPANAHYALRVSRAVATNFNHHYGIAWQALPDADGDGAHDGQDNCTARANGPIVRDTGGASQRDTNNDGYGNACDGDLNNDGFVNAVDLSLFRAAFGTTNADADFDGNGSVNAVDLALFRGMFGLAPGPSAWVP